MKNKRVAHAVVNIGRSYKRRISGVLSCRAARHMVLVEGGGDAMQNIENIIISKRCHHFASKPPYINKPFSNGRGHPSSKTPPPDGITCTGGGGGRIRPGANYYRYTTEEELTKGGVTNCTLIILLGL